jgi:hypothetical protein
MIVTTAAREASTVGSIVRSMASSFAVRIPSSTDAGISKMRNIAAVARCLMRAELLCRS